MRLFTLISLTVLSGAGFIGGIAQAADTAGAPLDPEKCKAAWTEASPNGDTLSKDAAVPYVINFTMVDSDGDGQVSADEFNAACAAGLIKADTAAVKDMN
jgi:hypothetical protein